MMTVGMRRAAVEITTSYYKLGNMYKQSMDMCSEEGSVVYMVRREGSNGSV
jgi:hypothetical protein